MVAEVEAGVMAEIKRLLRADPLGMLRFVDLVEEVRHVLPYEVTASEVRKVLEQCEKAGDLISRYFSASEVSELGDWLEPGEYWIHADGELPRRPDAEGAR